jgi:DNA-binding NarL/FixJ family response regulator
VIAEHASSVRSLRFALREAPGLRVIGTVDGRTSVRAALTRQPPEIVLAHESCQRANLIARIREARTWAPSARVVLLSTAREGALLDDAFACGAHIALDPGLPPRTLALVLQEIAHGSINVARDGAGERSRHTDAPRSLRLVRDQDAVAGTTA